MVAIEADFNHLDGQRRLLLADLLIQKTTPFAEIAASGDGILFVDSGEFVEGTIDADEEHRWVGVADWDTQGTLRTYPANRTMLARVI